jgi:hypothetical protein
MPHWRHEHGALAVPQPGSVRQGEHHCPQTPRMRYVC